MNLKKKIKKASKKNFYDTVVIGAGPAGEGAAIMASKKNKRVIVIDKQKQVGGCSTHWGTIPSKSIRKAITNFIDLQKTPHVGLDLSYKMPTFPQFLQGARAVIVKQTKMRQNFYDRNFVEVKHAVAHFINGNEVEVKHPNGEKEIIHGKNFIIATGSRPYHPNEIDFTSPRILDSDKVLSLKSTPKSIIIYGAGVIGSEYACMFKDLGIKVDLINTRSRLMDFLDEEIIEALNYNMRSRGIVIRNEEEFDYIETHKDHVTLALKSGKKINGDYIFWAQGRTGNIESLNLDSAGVKTKPKGLIEVDENYQTSNPAIFAVGDVIGWPSLAGAAYDQGRHAAAVILKIKGMECRPKDIPTGIYTDPEISCIGKNEHELTKEGLPYDVGVARFQSLAKAQMHGEDYGMLKLLFHRETLQILGIHCFGREASEIIHIGQAIMLQPPPNNTIKFFLTSTFNYPTMAEAYRVAALNGYNRVHLKAQPIS